MTKNSPSKKSAVAASNKSETLAKAQSVNIETALSGLTAAKTKIARTLAEIEEELIEKHSELQAVSEAIKHKEDEMKALHGADNVLMSLDELRVKLEEEKAAFEKKKEDLERELTEIRDDEQQARTRENAEYEYEQAQARKRDEDQWNAQKQQRAREESLRISDLERTLAAREAAMKAREDEYNQAIELAKNYDARVQSEVKREVAIATNSLKKDNEHATALAKAATDAEISNLKKDIAHRDQSVASLEKDNQALRAQLAAAIAAQSELAKAAVDNAKAKEGHAEAMSTFVGVAGGNGARPRG